MALPAVAVTGVLLAACAGAPMDADDAQEPGSGGTYAAFTTILQAGEDVAPELCLGGVMESYPPQCGGPEVAGLDWDDVADAETASGVTWGTGWVIGTYDAEAAVFTLTEPVSQEPPTGIEVPAPAEPELPPLCEDPYRGGDDSLDPDSGDGMAAREDLVAAASALDGYIALYVSDGSSEFNVLVQGDAEPAHAQLREVWPGWLCVATGSGAAEADVLAAQEALHEEVPDVLGSGGSMGVLEVDVVVVDDEIRQAVLDAVEPWLTPDQVQVSGVLVPT